MKPFTIRITLFFLIYFLVTPFPGFANISTSKSVQNSKFQSLIDQSNRLVINATNHDSVTTLLNEADELAKMANDSHNRIDVLILKGLNEYYSSNYEFAMDYYYKALSQAEQKNDSLLISKVNHNLAMVFDELEDYDESIRLFKKSLEISTRLKDSAQIARTYQNIAISYQNKKDLKKALEYNEMANRMAIVRKDTMMIIDITNNFGTIAYDQKKIDESLEYYLKALDLYKMINDQHGIAMAYSNIGLAWLDKKDYQKSLQYFMKSLKLANELKMYDFTGDIYNNLTVYYAELKDYKNAYLYYDKFNEVYDSLVGEKKNKTIRQIQAKFQHEKNTRELENLKQTNQTQLDKIQSARLIQIYLISIALLVVGLLVALFYLLYKEKRLAAELKNKSDELRELNISKDKFFSIIAHDLKNPFSILVSYTSLLKSDFNLFSPDELKQIISDLNRASETGFDLLQNLLLWTRSQTNRIHVFKTKYQLKEIIDNVKDLVELNLIDKEQLLETEIDENLMVYADKDMVSTVLRNLIFNAVKFSPKGSLIRVRTISSDFSVQIDVIDKGVGIQADIMEKLFRVDNDITTQGTEGETGSGLGLVLCHEFVEKNDGKIWVESEPGKGSVFSFTLPIAI